MLCDEVYRTMVVLRELRNKFLGDNGARIEIYPYTALLLGAHEE